MNAKPPPVTPNALPIVEALQRSGPLASLRQQMQDSNARLEVIRPLLPAGLAAHLKAGPVDEAGWSLLAPNAAVAAKLRQLQPRLEAALQQRGWTNAVVRIKVHTA